MMKALTKNVNELSTLGIVSLKIFLSLGLGL